MGTLKAERIAFAQRTDQERWQRIHNLSLLRAHALLSRPGAAREALHLLTCAGIAKDKIQPTIIRNDWVPEMDKRFAELRKHCTQPDVAGLRQHIQMLERELEQYRAQADVKPWYTRWLGW